MKFLEGKEVKGNYARWNETLVDFSTRFQHHGLSHFAASDEHGGETSYLGKEGSTS